MRMLSIPTVFSIAFALLSHIAPTTATYSSYPNDFVDPDMILAKNWNSSVSAAESTILVWADELAALGPWSVIDKIGVAITNDKHDYLSWAPYSWPDCSNVGNTTELPVEEVWTKCNYTTRDGQFNPDRRLVNDTTAFSQLADAVLYNTLAWVITNKTEKYSQTTVSFIKTWFIDETTRMNPNLNYGQIQRGPDGQNGSHTGVLDLKCLTKIVSGIEILRKGASPDWTSDVDAAMNAWAAQYITWLETKDIALLEKAATNNHGSFYFNQLAALKILVGDMAGALGTINEYLQGIYQNQIDASGEQPLEAARTRPYHYRAYNLVAMVVNARLAEYASTTVSPWNVTTASGASIKTALDYTMSLPLPLPDPSDDHDADSEYRARAELYIPLAHIASVYNDPDGKYTAFLKAGQDTYPAEPWFLWVQPLWDQGLQVTSLANKTSGDNGGTTNTNDAARVKGVSIGLAGVFTFVLGSILLR